MRLSMIQATKGNGLTDMGNIGKLGHENRQDTDARQDHE
jgi:hypothetical protein